jgi:hypothetical protein
MVPAIATMTMRFKTEEGLTQAVVGNARLILCGPSG